MPSGPPNRSIKTDETMFAIIETLQESGGAGVTEVAEAIGMSKASVHHHLTTMREHGYVTKQGGEYRVGLQFFHVGTDARNRYPIYQAAQSRLRSLAEETGETAWCVVKENARGMFLDGYAEQDTLDPNAVVGSWTWLHCTASGKAILAHLSDDLVDDAVNRWGLPANTENTVTDPDALYEELARTRERGYALNFEESMTGIHAVGAPVLVDGAVVGGIAVAGAANRLSRDDCETDLAQAVLAAANDIELNLAYR